MALFNTFHIITICLLFSAVLADSIPEGQKPEEIHEPVVETDVKIQKEEEKPEGSPTTKVTAQFMGKDERVISVDFGEKVAVECRADGDPEPFFRWYRRRTDINSFWQNVGSTSFETLEIFESAVYICTARNIHNDVYDSVSSQQLVINVKQLDHSLNIHRNFEHSDESFRQSMMFRKPDNLRVAYLDSTIIVGVVLSVTIVVLLTIIVVTYCRRSNKLPYLPVHRSHVSAVSGTPEKFSHNADNYAYSHLET